MNLRGPGVCSSLGGELMSDSVGAECGRSNTPGALFRARMLLDCECLGALRAC
jgi:hypothetical protein